MTSERRGNLMSWAAVLQGVFWLATGLWPVFSMRAFESITGPKTDDWLVKTFGVLIGVVGAVLTISGLNGRVPRELALVGAGGAATLAGADVVYVARRRLRPVYLLDALAEVGLIATWAIAWLASRPTGK